MFVDNGQITAQEAVSGVGLRALEGVIGRSVRGFGGVGAQHPQASVSASTSQKASILLHRMQLLVASFASCNCRPQLGGKEFCMWRGGCTSMLDGNIKTPYEAPP